MLKNDAVERLLEKEKTLGASLEFEDILNEAAGRYHRIMLNGEMDVGAWSGGMAAVLIYDIPSVRGLIGRIMAEASAIIRTRSAGFVAH